MKSVGTIQAGQLILVHRLKTEASHGVSRRGLSTTSPPWLSLFSPFKLHYVAMIAAALRDPPVVLNEGGLEQLQWQFVRFDRTFFFKYLAVWNVFTSFWNVFFSCFAGEDPNDQRFLVLTSCTFPKNEWYSRPVLRASILSGFLGILANQG